MIIDETTSEIILDIAKDRDMSVAKVTNIVTAGFSTVRHIIENEVTGVIKLDFFGKFMYSHSYKKKKEEIMGANKKEDI